MNNLAFSMILIATISGFAPGMSSLTDKGDLSITAGSHDSPFACNVNAFTPAERKRHFDELGPLLRSLRKSVRELKNGYAFEFSPDQKTYQAVSEWAIQESRCCPFFQIGVRLESEGGSLWLELTGRKGTKEFIRDDFHNWFNP